MLVQFLGRHRWRIFAALMLTMLCGWFCMTGSKEQLKSSWRYPYPLHTESRTSGSAVKARRLLAARVARFGGVLDQAELARAYLEEARRTGRAEAFDKAAQTAQAALKQWPDAGNPAWLVMGHVAMEQHRFHDANSIARKVLERRPGNLSAQMLRATALVNMGRLWKAEAVAQTLIECQPGLGSYSLLGLVAFRQGRLNDAMEALEHGLRLEDIDQHEMSAQARVLLGRVCWQLGQKRAAKRLFQEARRIVPDFRAAHRSPGAVTHRHG